MIRSARAAAALAACGLMAGNACGGETGVEPPTITVVEVTSPLGALWDVGAGVPLAATARDAQGNAVSGAQFTWTSTPPGVVAVSAAGGVDAVSVGTATIRAEADGVAGSLAVEVVDADLAGMTSTASDPYVGALVGGMSSTVRAPLQATVADCTGGLAQGHLELIQECIAAARAEAAQATDPTDRALLAVLGLFVDRLERLLNL